MNKIEAYTVKLLSPGPFSCYIQPHIACSKLYPLTIPGKISELLSIYRPMNLHTIHIELNLAKFGSLFDSARREGVRAPCPSAYRKSPLNVSPSEQIPDGVQLYRVIEHLSHTMQILERVTPLTLSLFSTAQTIMVCVNLFSGRVDCSGLPGPSFMGSRYRFTVSNWWQ